MKNQYFGDINDYRKYGILRILAVDNWLKLGICWMLTSGDGKSDGKKTKYLEDKWKWSGFDPILFDHLHQLVCVRRERDVRLIENAGLLPGARFYGELITDDLAERQGSFAEMLEKFRNVDLIFFDPDNGLAVKSVPMGRKKSSKYLYWDELERTFAAKHSVMVYQHFPHENREGFIKRVKAEICSRLQASSVLALATAHVVIFLAAQPNHEELFHQKSELLKSQWNGQVVLA